MTPTKSEDVLPERIWAHLDQDNLGHFTLTKPSNLYAEYIRADLARTPAIADGVGVEWLPIEIAPKNRKLLLGYHNAHGNWRTVTGQWFDEIYCEDEETTDGHPGWYETAENADDIPNCWWIKPTHWMPLPSPPQAATDEGV